MRCQKVGSILERLQKGFSLGLW